MKGENKPNTRPDTLSRPVEDRTRSGSKLPAANSRSGSLEGHVASGRFFLRWGCFRPSAGALRIDCKKQVKLGKRYLNDQNCSESGPNVSQKRERVPKREPRGAKGGQRAQKGSQRSQNGAKECEKGAKQDPNGDQNGRNGPQRAPKRSQMSTRVGKITQETCQGRGPRIRSQKRRSTAGKGQANGSQMESFLDHRGAFSRYFSDVFSSLIFH